MVRKDMGKDDAGVIFEDGTVERVIGGRKTATLKGPAKQQQT